MNLKKVISLFTLVLTFSGFSQTDEKVDSTSFETRCDCLKTTYLFKKEFLENITSVEERVVLKPEFIEKHDFKWEKLESIQTRCYQLNFSGIEPNPCEYEEKLAELAPDFELVLRVINMNRMYHGDY